MAFTTEDLQRLDGIRKQIHKQFRYVEDHKLWKKSEHWEDDETLIKKIHEVATIKGDCEEFARCCLYLANKNNYHARLIVGYLQGVGHCWTEVTDIAYEEAVYMDNNYHKLLARKEMRQHQPIMASPWNPYPGDPRNWVVLKTK